MKNNYLAEIKQKSVKDLAKELAKLQIDLANLKLVSKSKPDKDSNIISKTRKKIAQISTLINEKKFVASASKKNLDNDKVKNSKN